MNMQTFSEVEVSAAIEGLRRYGFTYPVSFGIQVQLTAAWAEPAAGVFEEREACNHCCLIQLPNGKKTGGAYACDASFPLNKGIKRQSFAPAGWWIERLRLKAEGQLKFLSLWRTSSQFRDLCERMKIPPLQAEAFFREFSIQKWELNLFGGEILLYPYLDQVTRWGNEQGANVNWTTTGRELMLEWFRSREKWHFLSMLMDEPTRPKVLAMSLDQILSVEDLDRLADMGIEQLYAEWKTVPSMWGQRQKVIEAIAATKIVQNLGIHITVLYNVVVHPGNIKHVIELYGIVTEKLGAIFNPYFAQSSFQHGAPIWSEEHLPLIEDVVNWGINAHLSGGVWIPLRLQSWILYRAALNRWVTDPKRLTEAFSGYGLWRCYERPKASTYGQLGITSGRRPAQIGGEQSPWVRGIYAGGRSTCYWASSAVADADRVSSVDQVVSYHADRIVAIGRAAQGRNRCPGCIMTRLVFDATTCWEGIPAESPELVEENILLRQKYVGW